MEVKILGPSCANCLKLELLVMETLEELGIRTATVEKVSISHEIEKYMAGDPPGLMIDGKLVWSGGSQLPNKVQIAEWIGEVVASR